jgi:hypothetical protein
MMPAAPVEAAPLLRPLWLDILGILAPLGVGALALGAGRLSFPLRAARYVAIALAAGGLLILADSDVTDETVSEVGGPAIALCWVHLLLLGVLWGAVRARPPSLGLVVLLALSGSSLILMGIIPFAIGEPEAEIGGAAIVVVWLALLLRGTVHGGAVAWRWNNRLVLFVAAGTGGLILIQAGACLWWRFCEPEMWDRTVDERGALQQSTGCTCYPASAVMLLHHPRIASSEEEMAYLANTSLGGTDDFAMVRALTAKGEPHGWHAETDEPGYDKCVRRQEPFIAHVDLPDIGLHAIFVDSVWPDFVEVVDPIDGVPTRLARADFEDMWNGALVRLVRD